MTASGAGAAEIFIPRGFSFSAVKAGIKASGRPDLGLIEAASGTTAAAVFTKNRVVAAPLLVGRRHLAAGSGRVRAVLVNAGNANCATGKAGEEACQRTCKEAARLLSVDPKSVFPGSTGIIGVPFPAEKVVAALPGLIAGREASSGGLRRFAEAIMTTDTRVKLASARLRIGKQDVLMTGVAKGAGMIHPQLATMLVYILTDAAAAPAELRRMLHGACDETFNCLSIDGDTSTNDTVLLLASGQSGISLRAAQARSKFAAALTEVCGSLAEQIARDGEGVKHVIRLHVEQARSRDEALRVAKAIAHSLLVKTAWAGADPNWGRILTAAGACGVAVDPAKIEIAIADQTVFREGTVKAFDEKRAHEDLSEPSCDILVRLGRGKNRILFLTTDLTAEYVHINADYST